MPRAKADRSACLDCGVPLHQQPGPGTGKLRCDPCWDADRKAAQTPGGVDRRCPICGDPSERWCTYCSDHRTPVRPEVSPPPMCRVCKVRPVPRVGALYCTPTCRRAARNAARRVANLSPESLERARQRERRKSQAGRPYSHRDWKPTRIRVFAGEPPCGICSGPIDYSLKYPDPQSASVDHIVSWRAGGAWFDLENLQAAHFGCNAGKQPPRWVVAS